MSRLLLSRVNTFPTRVNTLVQSIQLYGALATAGVSAVPSLKFYRKLVAKTRCSIMGDM